MNKQELLEQEVGKRLTDEYYFTSFDEGIEIKKKENDDLVGRMGTGCIDNDGNLLEAVLARFSFCFLDDGIKHKYVPVTFNGVSIESVEDIKKLIN